MPRTLKFAVITLVFSGCGLLLTSRVAFSKLPPSQVRVLGRLGGLPALQTEPPGIAVAKQKIGPATRSAVRLSQYPIFDVKVSSPLARIVFSVAYTGVPHEGGVRLAVQTAGGTWQERARVSVAEASNVWVDKIVGLERGESIRALRFEVYGDVGGDDSEIFIGALRLVGEPSLGWLARLKHGLGFQPIAPQPNVVLVSLDTLSARVLGTTVAGKSISSNLDQILAQGGAFAQTFAQYPNTLVSHASLLTGLYPRHHGVCGEADPIVNVATLAEAFAAAGYVTAAFTEDAFVGSNFGFDRGFDRYDDGQPVTNEEFQGDAAGTFKRAIAWMGRHVKGPPVLLFLHTYEVHTPYTPRDAEAKAVAAAITPDYKGAFGDAYVGGLAELAHNSGKSLIADDVVRHLWALYAGEVNYLDRQIVPLWDALRGHFPADQSIVAITADHGDEFNEHGYLGHGDTLFDTALHVPLSFVWQTRIKPGRYDDLVQSVDVAPTLAELAKVPMLLPPDGRSLAPLLLGRVHHLPERPAFAELTSGWGACKRRAQPRDCQLDMVMVRNGEFKLLDSPLDGGAQFFDIGEGDQEELVEASAIDLQSEQLREWLDEYRRQKPISSADRAPADTVDAATEERLRALGYRPAADAAP